MYHKSKQKYIRKMSYYNIIDEYKIVDRDYQRNVKGWEALQRGAVAVIEERVALKEKELELERRILEQDRREFEFECKLKREELERQKREAQPPVSSAPSLDKMSHNERKVAINTAYGVLANGNVPSAPPEAPPAQEDKRLTEAKRVYDKVMKEDEEEKKSDVECVEDVVEDAVMVDMEYDPSKPLIYEKGEE
jgi:hypothetical protein